MNKVIFPTGWLLDPATQRLWVYDGAGDPVIGLISTTLPEVLSMLAHVPVG